MALGAGLLAAGQAVWAADTADETLSSIQLSRAATERSKVQVAQVDKNAGLASGQTGNEDSAPIEEIQVTGSRIRPSGMNTPTPVTVMQADELSAMAPGNLIDALDQVPQFLNNNSPNTAASKADSAGASNANLRGVGSKRTLVLLNGNRVVPSNRLGNVDINLFPEDLVSRVETVTGGASAAYGTDAVAGVVNFILDTNYTGIKGHAQGGITGRGDNQNYEVGLTAGTDIGDKMHLLVSADHYEADRIDNLAGRNWYTGYGLVTNPDPNGPKLLALDNVNSTIYTNGGLISAPGTPIDRLQFESDGTVKPFVLGNPYIIGSGTQSESGGSGYNPTNYDTTVHTPNYPQGTRSGSFVPDSRRSSAFVYLDYDVSDNVKLYAQGLWGNNYANSVGTLPLGHSIWATTIYSGNPFLPASVQQIMTDNGIDSFKMERYNTAADIAQDRFALTNDTYSLTGGFNANIDGGALDGWQVNGHYQAGWNHNHLDLIDFIRRDRLPLALDAVRDPATGSIVCNITLVNPGSGYDDCVPLNLFGAGRASKEAINWVQGSMYVQDNTKQDDVEISANGDVYKGFGAGPVSLAVGASYRKQSITQRLGPDSITSVHSLVNDPANGIRGVPIAFSGKDDVLQFVDLSEYEGSFNVKEVFAETLVPLVSGKSFAQQLNLNLAARYADYSGSGGIWAWKAGVDWQVVNSLRLRGTISRDVRAGSLEERFDRQGQGTSLIDHQLADLRYTTFQVRGGNPNVNPERGHTVTIGAVWQPEFLEGFSASLDWYDIKVKGAIDLLGVQQIVDNCYNDATSPECARITRDPDSGRITLVENVFTNLGQLQSRGVDLELTYNKQVEMFGGGAETLGGRVLASWLDKYSTTTASGTTTDYVGQEGVAGAAYPDLRVTANVTYTNGPFSLFVQERYIDGGINNVTYTEGVDIADNSVDSVFYTDLRIGMDLGGSFSAWHAYLDVTNVFDRDPPRIPSWSSFSGTGYGTNESLYDLLGRRFVLGVKFSY